MSDPAYVQLPVDNATDNKNKIRSYSVVDDEGNTVLEQVSVIADASGTVLDLVDGGNLPTTDYTASQLLRAVIFRLDCIAALLDKSYTPPDQMGYE